MVQVGWLNIEWYNKGTELLWRKRSASFDIKFSSSENIFCKITPYSF